MNAELLKVTNNNPAGIFVVGKIVLIAFRLLEGSCHVAIGLFRGFSQIDAEALLLNEDTGSVVFCP